jgi:hypothetical protein
MMQDNKVSKAAKMTDIKNKSSAVKRLASAISETDMDLESAKSEHSAVVQ